MFAWGVFVEHDINSFVPTCVLLDLLLLEQKSALGGAQVTILPETYSTQQAQLSAVLGRLTVPGLVSYTSVFYGLHPDGVVVSEEVLL